MESFGLVDKFEEYCTAKGIQFLYGTNFYQNIESSEKEYANNQLVLGLDLNAFPSLSTAGSVIEIRYSGQILLGRKFELEVDEDDPEIIISETEASLDETYLQKYKNRLKDLSQLLTAIIITIQCENELETEAFEIRFDINKFDTNIDFVVANITFIQ